MSRPPQPEARTEEHLSGGERAGKGSAVQRMPTRGQSGSLPFTTLDKSKTVWDYDNGPFTTREGGSWVRITLGPRAGGYGIKGTTPGSKECTIVSQLNQSHGNMGNGWVKGHLWNEGLGGPGDSWNLTPMTHDTNMAYNSNFEREVKRMLDSCHRHADFNPNTPVWYGVEIYAERLGRMDNNPASLLYHVASNFEHRAKYVEIDRATGATRSIQAPQGFPDEID
jgi:hypothetical protein